jgi:hypothetical protein
MGETKFYDRRIEEEKKIEEEKLIQISIMVKKKDEKLIKSIFRNLKDEQENQTKLAYLGRRATNSLIEFAKKLAKANGIPEPEHFYNYHISLGGWILNVITHSGSEYGITKVANK